jgi:hypothetical protein
MKDHKLIQYKGNVVLDIIRSIPENGTEYRFSVLLTFASDDDYKVLTTIVTDIYENTFMDALRVGLSAVSKLYNNVAATVTVYDGDSGRKIEAFNLNELSEQLKPTETATSESNSELMQAVYQSKAIH